jgi:cellulose synthase/poly-beta-1,6-N-acetylglucosamine synthase-like glycosyltransferase
MLYPLLLVGISIGGNLAVRGDSGKTGQIEAKEFSWPEIAIVLSAHNEEKHILARITNILSQDYPAQKIKIYIGSDGSTDNTALLVKSIHDPRVNFFQYDINRGKASVLNDLMSIVVEPVVVFTDANTQFSNNVLMKLARHFTNESISGVCGELKLIDSQDGGNLDGAYWRLEMLLKLHESRINGFLGANGAIYAIRREKYRDIPADTITDDFTIFMNISLSGGKVIYDPDAIAYEETANGVGDEYKRRVRIGSGNYQSLVRLSKAFSPQNGWRLFTFVSHKVLRWVTPHLMVILLLSNIILVQQTLYRILLGLQIVMYCTSFAIIRHDLVKRTPKILAFVAFFVSMNVALGHGFLRYICRKSEGRWQRTGR